MRHVEPWDARHKCDEVSVLYCLGGKILFGQIGGGRLAFGTLLDEPERIYPRGVGLQGWVSCWVCGHEEKLRTVRLAVRKTGGHVGYPSFLLVLVHPIRQVMKPVEVGNDFAPIANLTQCLDETGERGCVFGRFPTEGQNRFHERGAVETLQIDHHTFRFPF